MPTLRIRSVGGTFAGRVRPSTLPNETNVASIEALHGNDGGPIGKSMVPLIDAGQNVVAEGKSVGQSSTSPRSCADSPAHPSGTCSDEELDCVPNTKTTTLQSRREGTYFAMAMRWSPVGRPNDL